MNQIEQLQYEAARVITGAWKGTSRDKLYKNLGWESLNKRREMRKLCIIYETLDTKFPNYLYKILEKQFYGPDSRSYNNNSKIKLKPFISTSKPYKLSFFPSTIKSWNNLEKSVKESKSKAIFKRRILNKIRPKKASYFGLRNHEHIRYLTMLRLELSPLRSHKFSRGFLDTTNELCKTCNAKEDTEHFCCSVGLIHYHAPPSCKKFQI